MGLKRFYREQSSHFVIESPCPPDNNLGYNRIDSTTATPAGAKALREEDIPRNYEFPIAGSSRISPTKRDLRPQSAQRIFGSSLAEDFNVHNSPEYRPNIRITHDRTVSQMKTSTLTPVTIDPLERRRILVFPGDNIAINPETPSFPNSRPTCRRHLGPRVDYLDGTELQPQPTLEQSLSLSYPFGHRHGRRHFWLKDSMSDHIYDNDRNLAPYPAPRRGAAK